MKLSIEKSTLVGIANAIRRKKGTSADIPVPNLENEIDSIPTGGGGLEGFDIETGTFVLYQDWVCANATSFNPYVIEHHLGRTPYQMVLFIEDCVNRTSHTINYAQINMHTEHSRSVANYKWVFNDIFRANGDTGSYASTSLSSNCAFPISDTDKVNQMVYADENNIYIGNRISPSSYQYILRAGNTYRWVAYARKEN